MGLILPTVLMLLFAISLELFIVAIGVVLYLGATGWEDMTQIELLGVRVS